VNAAILGPETTSNDPPSGELARIDATVEKLRPLIEGHSTVVFSSFSNYVHLKTSSYSALPFLHPAEIILKSQVAAAEQAMNQADLQYVLVSKQWTQVGAMEDYDFYAFDLDDHNADFYILRRKLAKQSSQPAGIPPNKAATVSEEKNPAQE
jgi:hypothetical protein